MEHFCKIRDIETYGKILEKFLVLDKVKIIHINCRKTFE